MRNIIIIVLVTTLVTVSCVEQQVDRSIEIINIDDAQDNSKEISLSQIVSNIEYIPLETTDSCFIAQVTQVFSCNKKFVIYDRRQQKVLLFDKCGNYICKVGNLGRGPGEYTEIQRVNVNEHDSTIVIKDNGYNFYDINGRFLQRFENFPIMGQISFLGGNPIISFDRPDYVYNNGFQIALCDNDFKVRKRFLNRNSEGIDLSNVNEIMGNRLNIFQYFCDTLSYWEYKYDTIYRIPNSKSCYPRYVFKYSNKLKFDQPTARAKKNNTRVIEGVIETDNYIFIRLFNYQSERSFFNEIIYDKNSKEVYSLKFQNGLYGILNDIDGGEAVLPRNILKDGRVYTTFSPFRMKQLIGDEFEKNAKLFNPSKSKELQNLIKNSKLQDNPTIMILTMK